MTLIPASKVTVGGSSSCYSTLPQGRCKWLWSILSVCLLACGLFPIAQVGAQVRQLAPGPSPLANPLQGLVPYRRPTPGRFPHSMEFSYIGIARVVTGEGVYDWEPVEELLDDIASRGNQAVLRFYLEYPGREDGIPAYLVDNGLKLHHFPNTNTAPFPPQPLWTPDYGDSALRRMLVDFIAALGERYDGDARLAYLTAGLLGTWGEWHTYPREELWASHAVQAELLAAYERHFRRTPVLLRYPAGPGHPQQVENASRPFGYHDDSLCWATLETGRAEDGWFFMSALRAAGTAAEHKWKRHPIGGEIRPEVWGDIFDASPTVAGAQPFADCAAALHLTWAMDSGLFHEPASPERLEIARREVAKLGYEFYVSQVDSPRQWPLRGPVDVGNAEANKLPVALTVQNRGLAPLYHAWPLEFSAVDVVGQRVQSWRQTTDWTGILPGQKRVYRVDLPVGGLPPGQYTLTCRIVNPLPNGKPVVMANQDWGTTLPDELTLGPLQIIASNESAVPPDRAKQGP